MADHRITDFVDQAAIDRLKELNTEMQTIKVTYIEVANALIKGLSIKVSGVNDINSAMQSLVELQKRASTSTEQLTRNMAEQGQIVANTTNTISRRLMEQERVNKATREEYTEYEKVKSTLQSLHGSYQENVARLVQINDGIKHNNALLKENESEYKKGRKTQQEYAERAQQITAATRALQTEKARLNSILKAEEKMNQSTSGSYAELSQMLELLKKAYKDLTPDDKAGEYGKELESMIQNLDAHLKDSAADMGEFQRNVGNYAIACQNGVVVTEDLNRVLDMQAGTVAGCIEQNKELEKAKLNLSTTDANYGETLDRINAKIEGNKRVITDVDAILNKEATSVGEAEAQNKQLAEALKLIDLNSEGAAKKVADINAKIEQNKATIERATPALQNQTKAIEEHRKASAGLVDQLGGLIGINTKVGSSFHNLGASAKSGGNIIDGLGVKCKAFGSTLMGLLSNPYMLAFLGIAGVAAGFKWWYDFNKGLIEASRLTENFTGFVGDAADKVTADMSTLADKMGKGYNETIGAANTLVQQFGLSWDEAYEKMKDGIAAGADMSGNMVSNIDRFAPALRDAGVSADEFMAILSNTRNGIFNEEGIQNIMKAGTRLRAMNKQTEESLNAVGISAQKMQQDLADGNITMLEAVQQVASRLKELPENAQEAGLVMKNVFGRSAAEGGELLIQSIADVNTNLDECKESMGELGRINEEQMDAQRRLQEVLMSVFKASGTSFEGMITQAKTFATKALTKVIEGLVGVVNWFIRIYNKSIVVRGALNSIVTAFKNIFEVCKFVVNQIIDAFKALGTVIEGVLTLNVDKITAGYRQGLNALKANVVGMVQGIIKNTNDSIRDTINSEMKEINLEFGVTEDGGGGNIHRGGGSSYGKGGGTGSGKGGKGNTQKEAEEALKRIQQLDEAEIEAMEDGLAKQLKLIEFKFKKKIAEIKGNSEEEKKLRLLLIDQMNQELEECERKWNEKRESVDLNNRIALVEKNSKEEYDLKLEKLRNQCQKELEEASKTGADKLLISDKYDKLERELKEEYAGYRMKDIQDRYAAEQVLAENQYNAELARLKRAMADELDAVGNNAEKREEIERKYNDKMAGLAEQYSLQVIQSNIDMTKEILANDDLSAEDRAALLLELNKLQIDYENAHADAVAAANERILENDKTMFEKRMENAQQWLSTAADGLNAINDLAAAVFSAKIANIEAEMDLNTKASEEAQEKATAEQELISELVEKKVISQEEGEARKRAAAAKTAEKQQEIERRNQELEKKKQQMQYRQAVWDKANKLAQAGISTALGIMQTIASVGFPAAIPMIAVVGALGALQLATITATPIPKYKTGTDYHKGGLAIVGDGGKAEVVFSNGEYYVTPDSPTLVDIPQGAKVYPDAERFIDESVGINPHILIAGSRESTSVNVDFTRLERKIEGSTEILKAIAYQQRGQHKVIADAIYHSEFQKIKNSL